MAHNPALMYHVHAGERYYLRHQVNGTYKCSYCSNTYPLDVLLMNGATTIPYDFEAPTMQLARLDSPRPIEVEVIQPRAIERSNPPQSSGSGAGGLLVLLGILFVGAVLFGGRD